MTMILSNNNRDSRVGRTALRRQYLTADAGQGSSSSDLSNSVRLDEQEFFSCEELYILSSILSKSRVVGNPFRASVRDDKRVGDIQIPQRKDRAGEGLKIANRACIGPINRAGDRQVVAPMTRRAGQVSGGLLEQSRGARDPIKKSLG